MIEHVIDKSPVCKVTLMSRKPVLSIDEALELDTQDSKDRQRQKAEGVDCLCMRADGPLLPLIMPEGVGVFANPLGPHRRLHNV